MKKEVFFKMFFLGCFILCANVFAHPPSEIIVNHDPESEEIVIAISHSSGNPEAHYIERVEIFVNGVLAMIEVPPVENDPIFISDVFDLDLKSGDVVLVQAFCNRVGDLGQEIIIE